MTTAPGATGDTGRAANVALWVVQVVTAIVFLFAALGKFTGSKEIVQTFDAIGLGAWFRYLIGVLEIAGVLALFIPRLAGLAGLAFTALMVGAVIVSLAIGQSPVFPLVLLVLSAVIGWGRRRRTARLVALVSRR